MTTLVDKKISAKIFGIPYAYQDETIQSVSFKKMNLKIKKMPHVKNEDYSTINNILLDFVEQKIIYEYFTVLDIISKLGGIGATATGIIEICMVLFLIHFIW